MKRNIGYERNPTWIYEDLFYCTACLTYARKKVKETREGNEYFGQEYETKLYADTQKPCADSQKPAEL